MRKTFIAFVLLFALSVGGVRAVFTSVNAVKDQVTFTQTTVAGDESAAHGLTVNFGATYDDHLFWESTYVPGTEPKVDTEFDFSAQFRRPSAPERYDGVEISPQDELGFWFDGHPDYGFSAAAEALRRSVGPGESKEQIFKMSDYFEYYPFAFTLDLPGTQIVMDDFDLSQYRREDIVPGTEAYVVSKLQEFFKIPVPDSHTVHIRWVNREDGTSTGSAGSGHTDSERFYISTMCALTDQACYFTFDPHTNWYNLVDLSQIPGGYGIYRLPYEERLVDEELGLICGVKADELAMVYPLDPELDLLTMTVSPDQTRLLLYTIEGGKYMVTVIDLADMETLQRIEVADHSFSENMYFWVYDGGEFLVAVIYGGKQYAVLVPNKSGEYEIVLRTDYTGSPAFFPGSSLCSMDFDGRRLAIAQPLILDWYSHWWESCNFYLAVYDGSGLAYYGEYTSSLHSGIPGEDYYYPCRALTYAPITVQWTQ